MDAERDLVERDLVEARDLAVVVVAATALEALDDLALARGVLEALAADGHFGVAAVELEGGLAACALGALDPGLGGHQVGARGAGVEAGQPGVAGGRRDLGGRAQHRLAAEAVAQFAGEVFACTLFGALAQRAHPFETERKGRTVHDRVDRPLRRGLERLDARWNFGAAATPLSRGARRPARRPARRRAHAVRAG